MSHIVSIQTKLHDRSAISAACQRLNLAQPTDGTAKLFSGQATGLIVQFPGWRYPAVVDTGTGQVQYDNFNNHWGDQRHMDAFLQAYAVEKAKLEARKQGYSVSEQSLPDGSIRVQITTGQ